jgi:hypothetical protein
VISTRRKPLPTATWTASLASLAVTLPGLLTASPAPATGSPPWTPLAAPAEPLAAGPLGGLLGTPAPSATSPWEGTVSTLGKLIWEAADGELGMCSGAIVAAGNGSVVATAAHCADEALDGGPASAARAWFLPGYDRGLAGFRRDGWPVARFHLPPSWEPGGTSRANLPHDYAFLTVRRKDGRTIEETHGANRLVFAPVPEDRRVIALGYPAAAPHDGETPRYCAGPTRVLGPGEAASFNAGGLLLEDCGLTEGASGGPWIQDYDPAAESGTLVGVTSVGTGRGEIVGRPFPPEARALFDTAAGGARPR